MKAEWWNERFPVGTKVIYWSVFPDLEEGLCLRPPFMTRTRSEAWNLAGGAIVKVYGRTGGVCLNHLLPTDVIEKCEHANIGEDGL